jgi:hypothetical protein
MPAIAQLFERASWVIFPTNLQESRVSAKRNVTRIRDVHSFELVSSIGALFLKTNLRNDT